MVYFPVFDAQLRLGGRAKWLAGNGVARDEGNGRSELPCQCVIPARYSDHAALDNRGHRCDLFPDEARAARSVPELPFRFRPTPVEGRWLVSTQHMSAFGTGVAARGPDQAGAFAPFAGVTCRDEARKPVVTERRGTEAQRKA